jgi:hypothetical protein
MTFLAMVMRPYSRIGERTLIKSLRGEALQAQVVNYADDFVILSCAGAVPARLDAEGDEAPGTDPERGEDQASGQPAGGYRTPRRRATSSSPRPRVAKLSHDPLHFLHAPGRRINTGGPQPRTNQTRSQPPSHLIGFWTLSGRTSANIFRLRSFFCPIRWIGTSSDRF